VNVFALTERVAVVRRRNCVFFVWSAERTSLGRRLAGLQLVLFIAVFLPVGCYGNLPVLNLLSASVAKKSAFSPRQEKLCVESKNDCHLLELSRCSLSACKVWGDRTTRAGCRSENRCFLYVTPGLPARRGHSSNKYCVTVYGSILMWFSASFRNGSFFQMHYIVLLFVARWRHNFREISVKNCEKSKNRRKSVCAPLRIRYLRDLKTIPLK